MLLNTCCEAEVELWFEKFFINQLKKLRAIAFFLLEFPNYFSQLILKLDERVKCKIGKASKLTQFPIIWLRRRKFYFESL